MAEQPCEGFQWIGQAMTSCDRCGHDLREHPGVEVLKRGGPFTGEMEVVSFEEAAKRMPLFRYYCTPLDGGPMRWEPLTDNDQGPDDDVEAG